MINTNGYFAGELEIYDTAKAFNINIVIIEYIEEYKGYIKKEKFEIKTNITKPILILEYTNINNLGHFNVVHISPYQNIKDRINPIPLVINNKFNYYLLQKINQNNFNYIAEITNKNNLNIPNKNNKINNNLNGIICDNNNNKYFEISNNSILFIQPNLYGIKKKYENNDIKNSNINKKLKDNNSNNDDSNNVLLSNKENIFIYNKQKDYKKELIGKSEKDYILRLDDLKPNFYPIFPNSINGYTCYYDNHKYLILKNLNHRLPIYPDYINEATNTESQKKQFRNLSLNYDINHYNELRFKKLKSKIFRANKNNIKNRHLNKYNDFILLKIPFKMDYYAKLNELHCQKSHCNYKRLVREFNLLGYTYKGIFKDCKDVCQNCITCAQKHKKYFKREPCMQMIFTHVYERYIADLTKLPNELTNNRKYLYLLNIIDHFSKYAFSYILEKKTADIALNKIKDCLLNHGYPEEFGTDNGPEFSKRKINKFLLSKNIKFIHGKAFNPRSQGSVERLFVNKLIKK